MSLQTPRCTCHVYFMTTGEHKNDCPYYTQKSPEKEDLGACLNKDTIPQSNEDWRDILPKHAPACVCLLCEWVPKIETAIQSQITAAEERGYIEGQKNAFGVDRKRVFEEGALAERARVMKVIENEMRDTRPEIRTWLTGNRDINEGWNAALDTIKSRLLTQPENI